MVNFERKNKYDISDFRRIMEILRGEGGCPWDAEQTHESIRRNMLEEAYESVAAIDSGDMVNLCEELGDLQMQILFHSRMEEEKGGFSFDDVCDAACRKLIYRHPHVFADVSVADSEEVLSNWETLKKAEKGQATVSKSLVDVAETLPSLWRAEKVQKKAGKVGFDWTDWNGPRNKVLEELSEVADAVSEGNGIEEEIGDLLFAAVNLSRHLGVDPEKALHGACGRFIDRFSYMELAAGEKGVLLEDLSFEEMDSFWDEAKNKLKNGE